MNHTAIIRSLVIATCVCCVLHIVIFHRSLFLFSSSSSTTQTGQEARSVHRHEGGSGTLPPLSRHRPRPKSSTLSASTHLRNLPHLPVAKQHRLFNEDDPAEMLLAKIHVEEEKIASAAAGSAARAGAIGDPSKLLGVASTVSLVHAPKLKGWSFMVLNDEPSSRAATSPPSPGCVGWKATAQCRADGQRLPAFDRGCAAEILPPAASSLAAANNDNDESISILTTSVQAGYCDCGGGERLAKISCRSVEDDDDEQNDLGSSLGKSRGKGSGDGDADAEVEKVNNKKVAAARKREKKLGAVFTCQDVCDRSVVAAHIAAVVRSGASLTAREKRIVRARQERHEQRLGHAGRAGVLELKRRQAARELEKNLPESSSSSSNNFCVSGFVASRSLSAANGKCGSVTDAIQRWESDVELQKAGCDVEIPAETSGICFCSNSVLVALTCRSSWKSGGGGGGGGGGGFGETRRRHSKRIGGNSPQQLRQKSDQPLTCESLCSNGQSALGFNAKVEYAQFISPLAGALRLSGLESAQPPLRQTEELEKLEVARRSRRLKLLESHIVMVPRLPNGDEKEGAEEDAGGAGTDSSSPTAMIKTIIGEPDAVSDDLRVLVDIERQASKHSNMLRHLRRGVNGGGGGGGGTADRQQQQQQQQDAGALSFTHGGIAGGGHAGSVVDAKFEDGVQRAVDDSKKKKLQVALPI